MELFVFWAAPLRMSDKTIDDERPMRLRHAALGRAAGEARECLLDLSSGRFALRRTVQPFDESIVGFQVGFHGNVPDALARRVR